MAGFCGVAKIITNPTDTLVPLSIAIFRAGLTPKQLLIKHKIPKADAASFFTIGFRVCWTLVALHVFCCVDVVVAGDRSVVAGAGLLLGQVDLVSGAG